MTCFRAEGGVTRGVVNTAGGPLADDVAMIESTASERESVYICSVCVYIIRMYELVLCRKRVCVCVCV